MLILEDLVVLAFSLGIHFWIEMLASLDESSIGFNRDQVVFLASSWCSGYSLFSFFFC